MSGFPSLCDAISWGLCPRPAASPEVFLKG